MLTDDERTEIESTDVTDQDARTTNLNPSPRSFVGRDRESQAIRDRLLDDAELLSIVGPPGVGKTELARSVASSLHEAHFCDTGGTWFIGLRDAENASDAVMRVARVLPVEVGPSTGLDETLEELGEWLENRSALLVFDNLEHIVEESRSYLRDILAIDGEIRILVTSREPLKIADETPYFLDPMSVDDATELYLRRAYERGFEEESFEPNGVVDLVERLDRIPLAIELAAAQLPALGPTSVVERLDRQLDLLQAESSETGRWESPLRNAIAWSWSLLNDWQRSTLAQCAIFRDQFSLLAAEEVLSLDRYDDAPPIPQAINALASKSLIYVDEPISGFRQFALYESIAEFARNELEQRKSGVRDRHLRYFTRRAEELAEAVLTSDAVGALDEFEASYRDMVDAFEHGLEQAPIEAARLVDALRYLTLVRTPVRDIESLVDRALAALRKLDDSPVRRAMEARLLAARSKEWYLAKAPLTEGIGRNYERALEIVDQQDSPLVVSRLQSEYGYFLCAAGKHEDARPILENALGLAREHDDPFLEFEALTNLGAQAFNRDDIETSRQLLDEALVIARSAGLKRKECQTSRNRAIIEGSRGNFERAVEFAETSLNLSRQLGLPSAIAAALKSLGRYLFAVGQFGESAAILVEGLELARETGLERFQASMHSDLGAIHLLQARWDDASEHFDAAIGHARSAHHPMAETEALSRFAALAYLKGQTAIGDERLESAREVAEKTGRDRALVLIDVMEQFREIGTSLAGRDDDPDAADKALSSVERFADEMHDMLDMEANEHARAGIELLHFVIDDRPNRELASHDLEGALEIGPEARWFELPDEKRVDLTRRTAIRRILLELASRRTDDGPSSVDVYDLIDAGWPGEKILPESGKARVYTSVGTLRNLGLEGILLTDDEGYFLDPDVPIVIHE